MAPPPDEHAVPARACSRRRVTAAVSVLTASLLLGACDPEDGPRPGSERSDTSSGGDALPDPATAAAQLAGLTVGDRRGTGPAYVREAFGEAWADVDGNGCNQRDDVLLRDAVPNTVTVARQGTCDHDVLAGDWVDPYTGQRLAFDDLKDLAQAQAIQIDHVVPLAEAWLSGAWRWDGVRRERFANDLTGLLAVAGPTNAGKGSSDPAAWRPAKAYQCGYATRWIVVKHRWQLTVDPSEVRALEEMLGYCP